MGLATAGFLVVVGLTGSLLAFYEELDALINPHLSVPARPGAVPLDLATLAERAQALAPQAQVTEITLRSAHQAEARVRPWPAQAAGATTTLDFDNLLLDPYTGNELGRRRWGDLGQGWTNLMPFVYRLHYELALDSVGLWTLGIVALAWTLDCLWSLVLTLPAPRRSASASASASARRGFWARWMPSWQIKHPATGFRRVFDLHRATSLWLWLVLLGFAWSSVYMNLWDTVYTAVTRSVPEYRTVWTELPPLPVPRERPGLSWRQAQERGEALMAAQAGAAGLVVERAATLRYVPQHGAWLYRVHSSADVQARRGRTDLYFDADTGAQRLFVQPSGRHAGNTVTEWLYALHKADVFGLAWRIFVCALGLVVAMLAGTGVWIWLKKRGARRVGTGSAPD
ncbi:PepSY-associated TM helix domain-containing protein [Sphaerotilus sp.]|uniref:PepSY-associated TM helix domain-containing protein n=1 Tax=Sphaerotilus sp. TaxID=2093942 RepID=UPI002ACEECA6|nr:PepSY-associated TM helix domain-containing protein [Sphaerotilus sp.]MDZ7855887.1 PepSY-associated TM helix domain-containing protein [Sphaerotilus sp.]